jgi:hypothetical protein
MISCLGNQDKKERKNEREDEEMKERGREKRN